MGIEKRIETERLILREYTMEDFDALYEIMSDPETMEHYPQPFDEARTRGWITWNLDNYKKYGFGLWAVVLKETGEFIGDCGVTIQEIDGEFLPEIGYHIHKKYWRRGFGSEAARAVRDWAFLHTEYDCIYSYMKYTNVGSYSTAIANGMKKVKEYPDEKNKISYAYAITRGEWEKLKEREKEKMLGKMIKSVLEQDRAAIVLCDLSHTIVYMNPAAKKRYEKWGGEGLLGKSLKNCHNEKSGELIEKVLEWFRKSRDNHWVYTYRNEKENRDVYMVALRDEDGTLIGYYEKHEYRNAETAKPYDFSKK